MKSGLKKNDEAPAFAFARVWQANAEIYGPGDSLHRFQFNDSTRRSHSSFAVQFA